MTGGLAGWLLACIADDEEVARSAEHVRLRGTDGAYTRLAPVGSVDTYVRWVSSDQRGHHIEGTALMQRFDPARVLAECAAKRAIVEQYRAAVVDDDTETDHERGWQTAAVRDALEQVVHALAAPFADRPGFGEEWRR